jgi:hypothetical protein
LVKRRLPALHRERATFDARYNICAPPLMRYRQHFLDRTP